LAVTLTVIGGSFIFWLVINDFLKCILIKRNKIGW
jgi:hypothetical protein